MTYTETLDYLFSQIPVYQMEGASAYKPGFKNILSLSEWCNNPHRKYPSIHIGGTNGKGSVSHLTASILQESGYKVGLYTSPHLKDFRERIRVNGIPITEERVISFIDNFKSDISKDISPSFFELTTELAFCWFAESNVDVAVIEVGLGGRLDSTNIIQPDVSVITNISMDHIALLGNTPEKIAYEKAGIIKKNTPLIIGHAEGSVKNIFENRAEKLSAPIHFAEDEFMVENQYINNIHQLKVGKGSIKDYKLISCPLGGICQKENAGTVLSLTETLRQKGFKIVEDSIYKGFINVIKNTGLRGRWETLSENPKIICDTGHNVGGFKYIAEQLKCTPHCTLHIVFGMVNDKDTDGVLKLLPKDAVYYFTKAQSARSLDEKTLLELAKTDGLQGKTYPTVGLAMDAAKKNYHPNDLIFVGGSNFIVAELI
jgi:dihydrofolate synthase / folylpolyglutamate synthase